MQLKSHCIFFESRAMSEPSRDHLSGAANGEWDGLRSAAPQLATGDFLYRFLIDSASDMIVRSDLAFRRLYVSPACKAVLGYSQAEMIAMPPAEMRHPDDLEAMEVGRQALLAGQPSLAQHYRMRHRDGHYVWLESRSHLICDEAGRPGEIVSVVRDETAAIEAAAKIAEATERLRMSHALLCRAEAMTHLGHWRLDLRTQEVFWSDEVYRIHGLPLGTTPTLKIALEAYHPDDRQRVSEIVGESAKTGSPFAFDSRTVRPTGEVRHVTSIGEVEFASDGSMAALVGTFQDVTERLQLEADLREAQKLEVIGKVAARVAHDFNNVLQSVAGGLELIQRPDGRPEEMRRYASVAAAAARRGARITQGLQFYARQQVSQPQIVALAPVLEQLRVQLAPLQDTAGIELDIDASPDCAPLLADPQHLLRALYNLAVNGIQAMRDGGRLSVRASSGRGRVSISVSDTGCGMDNAAVAQAFEPFFSTRGPNALGLGLSMVQGFARQCGGDVWLDSRPGQGTSVHLSLLAAAWTDPAPSPGAPAVPDEGCVLLVDDDPEAVVITAAFLRDAGFAVIEAAHGDAALGHLASVAPIVALVTDYAMPGMDGTDVILHAREVRPGIAALMITGYTELPRVAALPPGVEVLVKPFAPDEIARALRRALGRPTAECPPAPIAAIRPLLG